MINMMLKRTVRLLRDHPFARVRFPDDAKMKDFANMVQQREPMVDESVSWTECHSRLGWEFGFPVPISGNPIGSGIPIPFLIPKIPVGFFFSNSAVEKSRNWNSDYEI